jgi:integrase
MLSEATIKSAIKSAPASGKAAVELKDGGGRGEGRLSLRIGVSSDRLTTEWYAVWWRAEKRKLVKMGTYPTMGLADARKAFREDYGPEISAGRDPTGPRTRKVRRGVTVDDLFFGYVRSLKAADQDSWDFAERALLGPKAIAIADGVVEKAGRQPRRVEGEKVAKADRKYVQCAADALGRTTRAADVRAADIREHLASIHERGSIVMAARARTCLHSAFAWALKSANSYTSAVGLVDWGIEHNPVTAVPTDSEANRAGERHLTPSEFRAFWMWLEAGSVNSIVTPMLLLNLCTGQRVTEMLKIGDAAYDRGEKMLDWSKTKNGMPHAIPLPERAVTILDGLVANSQGLFFPSAVRPDEPVTLATVEKVVKAFVAASGVPHFTPRDLRRTWKTLAGAAGLSKDIRDRMQNHAQKDVSARHYDRYSYLPEKRTAIATWEAYMDRILAGDLDNPVTALRPAAEA